MNECATGAHNCGYVCKNFVGGFKCVCPEGYRRAGGRRCIGKLQQQKGSLNAGGKSIESHDFILCLKKIFHRNFSVAVYMNLASPDHEIIYSENYHMMYFRH